MAFLPDLMTSITERLRLTARVETVYGEPQKLHGRTVIPVARVFYGFGAGGGEAPVQGNASAQTSGGGGGGGISVRPMGALIISDVDERFISFRDWRGTVARAAAAFFFGYLVGRRAYRTRVVPPNLHQ